MKSLHHSIKRLEELEGINRARQRSEEVTLLFRAILSDGEMAEAAAQMADALREHGKESPEFQAAVKEGNPILEQGLERYKKTQAEEAARKEAR